MTLTKLVIEDKIYSNHDFSKFSLVPLEGYRKWSDYMAKEFKGYKLNNTNMTLDPSNAPLLKYD